MTKDDHNALPKLPARPATGHKGTFGTVAVLGGQCAGPRVMLGGPVLSALAALRAGSGLAVLAMPEPLLADALAHALPVTGVALPVDTHNELRPSAVAETLDKLISTFDCLAIGPGLGTGAAQQQVCIRLISDDAVPLVIDADAINVLADTPDFENDLRAPSIWTPHPGEFKRIAKPLEIDADPTKDDERSNAAEQLARRLGAVVVLKGNRTVVSNGVDIWTNDTGNVALATGGSGDVLTGVIASFVGQFFKQHLGVGERQITPEQQGGLSLYDCARLAVHVHGRAADEWSKQHDDAGMLSSDLLELIPAARAAVTERS